MMDSVSSEQQPKTTSEQLVGQTITEQFEKMDEKYSGLSLRLRSLGNLFADESKEQTYLLGIALGYKALIESKKDIGQPQSDHPNQLEPGLVERFYKNQSDKLSALRMQDVEQEPKGGLKVTKEIETKISRLTKDDPILFSKLKSLKDKIQPKSNPFFFFFGASMIREFVLENASK